MVETERNAKLLQTGKTIFISITLRFIALSNRISFDTVLTSCDSSLCVLMCLYVFVYSCACVCLCVDLPGVVRDECLQLSLLLLPDVHRQAVFYLLIFLNRVAQSASINQMGAHNLAVCLTPSLMASTCRQTKLSSPQRRDSFSIGRLMNRPRRKFSTMDRRRSRAEALDPTPTTPNNSLQPVSGCSNYSSPHIASPSRRRSLQWLRHLSSSNPQASPPPLSSLLHSSPRMTVSDNQVASAVSEKVSETGVVRSQHLGCSSAVDLPCLPSTNPLPSSLSWPSVPFPSSSGREFGQARTGCACLSNLILQVR